MTLSTPKDYFYSRLSLGRIKLTQTRLPPLLKILDNYIETIGHDIKIFIGNVTFITDPLRDIRKVTNDLLTMY